MRTLLQGGVVVTCDERHTVFPRGDILIEDDRISYADPAFEGEYDERVVEAGSVLTVDEAAARRASQAAAVAVSERVGRGVAEV